MNPYLLNIEQQQLDDLRLRLKLVRWPEQETVDTWSQGIPLAYMQEIHDYWLNGYDWHRCEKQVNKYPQFTTDIDGLDIHFLHIRSPHEPAMPLLITHGWPGSIIEFLKIIEPLTDPTRHGGTAEDAFHLVLPSLPGYGFSRKPTSAGCSVVKIGRAWERLMSLLGYENYVVQGGDWGAGVARIMAQSESDHLLAIHVNLLVPQPTPESMENLTAFEQKALADAASFQQTEMAYMQLQSTRPQTLGYGLTDSPIGQAAWILEKLYAWTDCGEGANRHPENALTRDELLDNVMMYWLTASGASSARLYWESGADPALEAKITKPVGYSAYPAEIFRCSRRWAEAQFPNLFYWNELDKGGHFAAFEQPEIFVDDLRNCFRALRW